MKKSITVLALSALFAVSSANAQSWGWGGGTDPYNWTDPAAWTGGNGGDYPGHTTNQGLQDAFGGWTGVTTVDLTIDTAIPIALDGGWSNYGVVASSDVLVTILAGGSLTELDAWVGRNNGKGHIDVNGGSFTALAGPWFLLANSGANDDTEGRLTVRGNGSITANTTVSMANQTDLTAIVTILDGTFYADEVIINNPGVNQHIMLNHIDSVFRLGGDQVAAMNDLIASGGLQAGPGFGFEEPVYDEITGYTELRIPEPGTLGLLGLAGLIMMIRRARLARK